MSKKPGASILFVYCQGAFDLIHPKADPPEWAFHTEYPGDADVYMAHALSVMKVMHSNNFTHLGFSGGHTQSIIPGTSEARSYVEYLSGHNALPCARESIILDELALDSLWNVLAGSMAARLALRDTPIEEICGYAAWQCKEDRFVLQARELGLQEAFRFLGFAPHEQAAAPVLLKQGEEAVVKSMRENGDILQQSRVWEEKRRRRNQRPDYDDQVRSLCGRFPRVFRALGNYQRDPRAARPELQCAFREEVLMVAES